MIKVVEDWSRLVIQRRTEVEGDEYGWADSSGGFSLEMVEQCDEVTAGLKEIHGETNVRQIIRRTVVTDNIREDG